MTPFPVAHTDIKGLERLCNRCMCGLRDDGRYCHRCGQERGCMPPLPEHKESTGRKAVEIAEILKSRQSALDARARLDQTVRAINAENQAIFEAIRIVGSIVALAAACVLFVMFSK